MDMKQLFPLLILSTIFLGSCNHSDHLAILHDKKTAVQALAPIPADFLPRRMTVVSAGDSLTEGIGDSTGKGGYLPYLKSMLEEEKGIKEVDFYNFGVKGNRTTQLLKRLKSPEIKSVLPKADLVILTIGGNDIMKVLRDNLVNLKLSDFKKEQQVYHQHLTQIMDTITKENPHASIVLIGLYNPFSKWFSNIKEMNQIVADWNEEGQNVIANYSNAYFVEIQNVFLNTNENLLYTDNFHPNDKGYKKIAQTLNTTLADRVLPDLEKKSYVVSTEEN